MNRNTAKRVGTELALIAGVVLAGHEFGVVPIVQRTANAQAQLQQIEQAQEQWAGYSEAHEQAVGVSLARLVAQAEALNELAGEVSDPSEMYSKYTQLANACGVQLERIDPNTAASASGEDSIFEASGYAVGVAGDYAAVVRFIGALQHEFELTSIDSVRMTPDPENRHDGSGVLATIRARHFALLEPVRVGGDDNDVQGSESGNQTGAP